MISQKVEESSGSTALAILIDSENIYCANIGDSRAVSSFSGHTCPLSFDHKPNRTDELKRVEVCFISLFNLIFHPSESIDGIVVISVLRVVEAGSSLTASTAP